MIPPVLHRRTRRRSPCSHPNAVPIALLACLALAARSAAAQNCVDSTRVGAPPGLAGHAMAYDPVRDVVVIFSGSAPPVGQPVRETWEWDGVGWHLRSTGGPPATYNPEMCWDERQVRMVLQGIDGGTWEWDGDAWSLRTMAGPGPRDGYALAYDSARSVTTLFGGRIPQGTSYLYVNDTWEWDGDNWVQRASDGPAARADHEMTYDARRGKSVLFGGYVGRDEYFGDTWEWDGESWARIPAAGPSARCGHSMAYDSGTGFVLLFGGYRPGRGINRVANDTWSWDGERWSQIPAEAPWPRGFHAWVYVARRDVFIMYGGFRPTPITYLNDLWEWDRTAWRVLSWGNPAQRIESALVYDAARRETILFAGYDDDGIHLWNRLGDTWAWNGHLWSQRAIHGPTPRYGHAMAYDSRRQVIVLFGGNDGVHLADTWEWDGAAWTLRSRAGPSARDYHGMTYDSRRGVAVMIGGHGGDPGETWEWDGSQWTVRHGGAPPASYKPAIAFDERRGVSVLFHSAYSPTPVSETWEWDGAAWRLVDINGVPPRSSSAITYDASRRATVVAGGYLAPGTPADDIWEWDGALWRRRIGTLPAPLDDHLLAFDAARNRFVACESVSTGLLTWQIESHDACDANCDGTLNALDIPALVNVLTRRAPPCSPCAGDADDDGTVNAFDIQLFVDCVR